MAGKVFFIDFFHDGRVVSETQTRAFLVQESSGQLFFIISISDTVFQSKIHGEKDAVIRKDLWREEGEDVQKDSSPPSVSFFDNRFNGACLKTAPTFRTFLFVDDIGLPFLNGFGRAFFRTGPAGHTFFRNDISHRHHPLSSQEISKISFSLAVRTASTFSIN
jgi:hypothetical protein